MKEVNNLDGVLVAAHELKAPLATLRQLALGLGELGVEDERVRTEMVSVSERAIRQVNDLTKLPRLEAGLFEMEPVAVRGVCDEVTKELARLFSYHRRELIVKYSNRERLVTANREMLHSVIYNFALNALHYADEGTRAELIVRDATQRARGQIAARDMREQEQGLQEQDSQPRQEKVRIIVRDYGPMLPMEIWREMRRGFVRQPQTIAMRPGSSGLGLFIASRFSRAMQAEVGAVRHRDGTSFYVELPVSKQMSLFGGWE